ncbi:cbb3-type cytochrome c oxidase subunit 3 [Halobacteriovorax sp. JY17]|uniref:cbb3-type cytochrome c oxidase subunit 3 n=1 Tax=Halobacteriovorax sp. JY17 TaxID=2014617 RepID=UPI000C66AC40|nr:cbb3-type cytochrome c oxidase subunit 3 [Halobacteriovorax sp. JY17]PIK15418.1 MAG: CcoQ/FixQ family Cbb3-type cytochrome c oxidase assembly chaperone [Halobacteriovorax sp. JY17]
MIKETLMNFDYSLAQTIVTILFVTLFVGMLIWINRKGSDRYYEKAQNLALEEGVKSERK